MASFMKMFKNKKGSNKENLPNMNRSTIERSSTTSNDFETSRSDAGVYAGEQRRSRELHIANPYSVVTAPKTTRGPRSCPGAPMEDRSYRVSTRRGKPLNDRYSSINTSLRYENVGRKRTDVYQHETILEYSSESANSSRGSPPDIHSRKDSRRSQSQRYYGGALNESTDDDEDRASMHIIQLEAKLKRAKELIRSTRRDMTERIEELQDEIERKSRDYDTLKWHYKQARKAIDDERKINARQTKKLHQALEEVSRLKALLAEHSNDSSFLIPYCGGLPPMGYDSGAGEALCSLAEAQSDGISDRLCSLNEVHGGSVSDGLSSQTEHTNTREGTAEPTLKLDNQEDMQDEVRVFRTAECDTPPPERPRAAVSPIEPLSSFVPLPDFTINNELVPQRSLSDTDIRTLVLQETEKDEMRKLRDLPVEKQYCSRAKPVRKDYDYYVRGYNEKMEDDGSISTSDEETCRIIEKQLKKKGDVVRFQPPRVTVHPRHYKRFGKMERCALAEFDYLQDISTDVSALQSSPDSHHSTAI
ncbi:hypothetical protein V3C99_003126 [Haemonchus contortus]|uniref:Protein kinase domain-containing protein n=1 Tax=Haemonchus contortus TaxID=6289 RepID=A0A6F7P099_HAECO|nr:Hypothetical protein CBG13621 [Haemonchus contortus]CDJ86678.1 Hypothetical protein CBG13621 [Haemonchus contortus]